MPRASAGISKRALGRVQRLCCLGIGSEMLLPDLLQELRGVVPFRIGWFRWAGPNLELRNSYSEAPAALGEVYMKEFHKRREREVFRTFDTILTMPAPGAVLHLWQHSLIVDRRTQLRGDHYNLLMRPCQVDEVLILRVREADRIHGALYIGRAAGEAPFDLADRKALESVAGFIAHAMTPAAVGEDAFVESDDRALLIVDGNGMVRHASTRGWQLLAMALNPRFSPATDWRGLHDPAPELLRLCRALGAVGDGDVGQPPPVVRLRTVWGEFLLRGYWFGPSDGTEPTRHIGITVERRIPRALAVSRRVEQLPLSPREKQFCLLLARNPGHGDVAGAMGTSPSTVATHQRAVYAKLGVHSRAQLVAALMPA